MKSIFIGKKIEVLWINLQQAQVDVRVYMTDQEIEEFRNGNKEQSQRYSDYTFKYLVNEGFIPNTKQHWGVRIKIVKIHHSQIYEKHFPREEY